MPYRSKSKIIALLCVTVAGCASMYVPPTAGPVAKIRVAIATDEFFAGAAFHRNGICNRSEALGTIGEEGRWVQRGAGEPSVLGMLGQTESADAHRRERLVAAGERLTVVIHPVTGDGKYSKTCRVAITFTPEANGQYEFVFVGTAGKKCLFRSSELTRTLDGSIVRAPIRDAVDDSNTHC